ncbi:HAD family phosphatase [Xinfangfangia sp. D13-10-4-6]|nr:HAD family phosphatase [Pseudogemmobacter hezensis]
MPAPAAVIFDCDGVIVDSEGPTFDLMIADLADHGFPLTLEELERDYIGGTVEEVARRAIAKGAKLPADWVAVFYEKMYAMLANDAPLIPGIIDLFDRLDAAGIPYAVGSNGTPEKMQITLGRRGLLPRFRATLSGQAIGKPKPAPDLYLACAKACGAAPENCVVIEDSPTGARAAIAAGIPCLGFAAHGQNTAPAKGLKALNIPLFHRMQDLPALLGL